MKQKNLYKLDDDDEKVIHIFSELGMPKNIARTLMYIAQVDECRSSEIEQGANLRQPEVSIAMQELEKKGWVTKRYMKKEGKGRPVHIYKLTSSIEDIVKTFEQEKTEEIEIIKKDLAELREMLGAK